MPPRKPVKPWRVEGPNLPEYYLTRTEAVAAALELSTWGHDAAVWQYVDRKWRLYGEIEAATGEPA